MKEVFKATAKKMPKGLLVETKARNFTVMIDEPKDMGGTDEGITPVENLLAALGACQTICAFAFAESQGIKLEDFRVELEGDLDPDGFMGKAPVRNGFQEIRFKMYVKTDASQEEVEKFVDFIESRCPVGDSIGNGVPLKRTGVVIE